MKASRRSVRLRQASNLLTPVEARQFGLTEHQILRMKPQLLRLELPDTRIRRYGMWTLMAMSGAVSARKYKPARERLNALYDDDPLLRMAVAGDIIHTQQLLDDCMTDAGVALRDYAALTGVHPEVFRAMEQRGNLRVTRVAIGAGRLANFLSQDEVGRLGNWGLPEPLQPAE